MGRYKSLSVKQMAERTFPWRVDIDVPGTGLGSGIDAMNDWCRERGCEWNQHGGQQPRTGGAPKHFARFYFIGETDALAFQTRWGGVLSSQEV